MQDTRNITNFIVLCHSSERSQRDHEASQQIKSVFMTNWDGLISSKDSRIVVMGATNLVSLLSGLLGRSVVWWGVSCGGVVGWGDWSVVLLFVLLLVCL